MRHQEVGAVKGQSVLALADSLDEYKRKATLWAVAPSDAQTAEGDLEIEINLRLTSQETHIGEPALHEMEPA